VGLYLIRSTANVGLYLIRSTANVGLYLTRSTANVGLYLKVAVEKFMTNAAPSLFSDAMSILQKYD
jgi:hypothetical protein